MARIIEKAGKDTRHRQRLESIVSRGHLAGLRIDTIRDAMSECDLDPDLFVSSDNELFAADDDVADLLYFLNEDLYR